MALRLRIVSEHAHRLGSHATKVLGVHGGTVGRSADNDWILPDPERYLSAKHLRVEFRAGAYFIVDTSSNGTFVNGSQTALGRSSEQQLKDGDYLRLGEYELLASIDPSSDFSPEEGAIVAYDGGPPSSAVTKATANDIGANLDLDDLNLSDLVPSDSSPGTAPVRASSDVYGQPLSGAADETPWHMQTRGLKVAQTAADRLAQFFADRRVTDRRTPRINAFQEADLDAGLAAVCRGAGIEPQTIAPEARATALHTVGQLLREVAVGLLDSAQSRADLRNQFRITAPPADLSSGNDFFAHGVDEAVARLIGTTTTRGGSVDAVRENFQEIKAQQSATLAGLRAAFEEFLHRLDPKDLAERFERNGKSGVFGTHNKGRYWELYAELFASIANRPADGFPHLFVEAFARAYEQQALNLPPVKRIAFGSDLSHSSDRVNEG